MNKFVLVKDNILSKKDCDNIIKTCDKNLSPSLDYQGYEYYDIKKMKLWKFLVDKTILVINDYLKQTTFNIDNVKPDLNKKIDTKV